MKTLLPLSTISLLMASAGAMGAQSDASKAIKTYYAKYSTLLLKKDIEGVIKLETAFSTPDYMEIPKPGPSGKLGKRNRAQEFAMMRQVIPYIDAFTQFVPTVSSVVVKGSTATALITSHLTMKTKKAPQDGKVHTMSEIETVQDTWVKVGGVWKIKLSKTLTESTTTDGRPDPIR